MHCVWEGTSYGQVLEITNSSNTYGRNEIIFSVTEFSYKYSTFSFVNMCQI